MTLFKKTVSLKKFLQSPLEVLGIIKGDGAGEAIRLVNKDKGLPIHVIITQEHYFRLMEAEEWIEEHVEGIKPVFTDYSDEETDNDIDHEMDKFMSILNEEDAEP